ncbi:MAG: DUF3604 domain-containing protein [Lachnospiraceae bacterium]
MRKTIEYMGSVSMTPQKDVMAGEFSTWVFTFTAGEYGIDDGGSLVLAWKSVSDWDTPQFDEPMEPGYTTVTTTGNCRIRARYAKFIRSFGNSICMDITGGYIKKGDTITITMGDRSQGSLGARAQSFCEREHEFRFFLDPCGTYRYEEMPQRLKVRIVPGYVHELQAIVPGTVQKGKPFDVVVRALDEFGNPTNRYHGTVWITVQNAEGMVPEKITFTEEDGGAVRLHDCVVNGDGVWHLEITDRDQEFHAYSNPSLCTEDDERTLYWGDMHGQTRETVGTGFLDDYYSFARDKAAVSFTGWQGNDFEVSDETWKNIREKSAEYTEEGKFLAFLGYEWSGTTPQGGDHNVYFLGDNENFYPSSNWTAAEVTNEYNANPIPELHEFLKGREDVMLIPHIGGRYANLDYLNPEFTSVIEIHSHHGTFEWFAMDAMKKRLKVGFIAASDDHTCRPGLSYALSGHGKSASGSFDVRSGFTGVYAKELTKESVWKAIRERRCYASTFDRILLKTDVNGVFMGQESNVKGKQILNLLAAGNCPVESVEIFDWEKSILTKEFLKKSRTRIRIRWSGVVYRGRGKSAKWDGMLYVENGRIRTAKTYAFDRIDQGILVQSDKYVKWTSSTSGDYDGLILDIDGDETTMLRFTSLQGAVDVPFKKIMSGVPVMRKMGGLNLQVEFALDNEDIAPDDYLAACSVECSLELPDETGEHAYWVKATQINGNAAWSSPVYLTRK